MFETENLLSQLNTGGGRRLNNKLEDWTIEVIKYEEKREKSTCRTKQDKDFLSFSLLIFCHMSIHSIILQTTAHKWYQALMHWFSKEKHVIIFMTKY